MTYQIDGISYILKQACDLSFLCRYGKTFTVFDQNDSGNISFGVAGKKGKYFIKIAGADTTNSCVTGAEAAANLKKAIPLYEALRHPALIELIGHYQYGDLYTAVFKWADGECIMDYRNSDKYERTGERSPWQRFYALPLEKRLKSFEVVCDFLRQVAEQGYIAIDFYDGSIMYDFETDTTTICDIDLFSKRPYINQMGKMWGSERFKSPEENKFGAVIDETTNVFTLGAVSFMFFGGNAEELRYSGSREFEDWRTGKALYDVAMKAASPEKQDRYRSIAQFTNAWASALPRQNQFGTAQ
ncbi:MAG: hypothetical protein LBQ91_00840 [Oscillospiraceae bacterium]|jgi:serine/threonine-protein kinase|nr:hypothetical protein [Oscillospiraceae bacterium]